MHAYRSVIFARYRPSEYPRGFFGPRESADKRHISHGSVATPLKCDGIFSSESVGARIIWRCYGQKSSVLGFFDSHCRSVQLLSDEHTGIIHRPRFTLMLKTCV